MQNRLIGFIPSFGLGIGAAVAAVCFVAAGGMAQNAPQARAAAGQGAVRGSARGTAGAQPAQRPDFSGVWVLLPAARQEPGTNTDRFAPGEPPMTPWAAEIHKAARVGIEHLPNEQGRDAIDPILYPRCLMPGFPRIYQRPGRCRLRRRRT